MNRYRLTTEGWSILNFVTCNNLLDHYGPSDHCSSHWGLGQLQSFALVILKSDRLFSYPWAMLWLDHCLVGALMWDLWLVYSNAVLLNVVVYESLLATLRHNLDLNLRPHWILFIILGHEVSHPGEWLKWHKCHFIFMYILGSWTIM